MTDLVPALSPHLLAEFSGVLAEGRPCQVPVLVVVRDALFKPERACGRPAVVAHLLHATHRCDPDQWFYVCASHDDDDWQCLKHYRPVIAIASYPIGKAVP